MSEFVKQFLFILIATQIISLVMLYLGSSLLGNPILIKMGEKAHDKKMKALDKMWPLTKMRGAIADSNFKLSNIILSTLIIIKSVMCFVFGIIVVVWLPLACLMVPSIIYKHNPDDPSLQGWVRKVSILQVTSHTLAGALGANLFLVGYADRSINGAAVMMNVNDNIPLIAIVFVGSLLFAIAAGKAETAGIMKRGI